VKTDYSKKATNQYIRERFDNDTERFSNLETGQQTTIDAPLTMELCTEAAMYANPHAKERILPQTGGTVTLIQDDMRNLDLLDNHFDIILAAATLHHLRDDDDWELMFNKIYKALKPGGSFWVSDLVTHDSEFIKKLFEDKYSSYLEALGGPEYRQKVLDYVNYEDTPRSLNYQLALLEKVGFSFIEVLHKHSSFAAFGAIK